MTKEEAKLVLDNARPQAKEIDRQFYDDEDLNNALDIAINSLENEEKLLKENRALKNRCKVSTQGLLCSFCPLECEQRVQEFTRGE